MDKKQRARDLRNKGKTYTEISNELGIAKSTLISWISDIIPASTYFDRKAHLNRIQKMAVKKIISNRIERQAVLERQVHREVNEFFLNSTFQSKCLASMLYWAEGSKGRGTMIFANTDPILAKFFITLLRKGFSLNEEKFRIRLHLHHYHDIEKSKKFWADLLNVPLSQFGKIYIKERNRTKKFRENFAGICFIRYHSEPLRIELLALGKAIAKDMYP